MTRPKPTIYGNCDSWSFIVGKTRRAYSLGVSPTRPLRVRNSHVMHRFSTIWNGLRGDNMWAACGSAVHVLLGIPYRGSRTVRYARMTRSRPGILTNPVLSPPLKLAGTNRIDRSGQKVNHSSALSFFDHRRKKAPSHGRAWGFCRRCRLSERVGSAGRWPAHPGAAARGWAWSCPPSRRPHRTP